MRWRGTSCRMTVRDPEPRDSQMSRGKVTLLLLARGTGRWGVQTPRTLQSPSELDGRLTTLIGRMNMPAIAANHEKHDTTRSSGRLPEVTSSTVRPFS
jgi:hypothetical protein